MNNRKLHAEAYSEWRDEAADEFARAQRRAFLAGFEAAAKESEEWHLLREWVKEGRDEALERANDLEDLDGRALEMGRRSAFIDVLVKLSEAGCRPEDDGE